MAKPSPGLLTGLTFPIVFGLLFLVLPLQGLIGGLAARLALFGVAFVAAHWFATARGIGVNRLGWVRPTGRAITFGSGLGAGLVAIVVVVMVTAGWYSVAWNGQASAVPPAVMWGVAVGLYEEALFRSLWFGGLEPVVGTWLTLSVSAVLFGSIHWFNPGATLVSSLAIALTAGVLLGAVFILRRDLWLVAAIHAAWNATLGGVFGMPVSGNTPSRALLSATEHGPDLWTGGSFGPEGSLVSVIVVGGVGLWFLWRARSSPNVTRPIWRHETAHESS